MKLKNKKTGEIVKFVGISMKYDRLFYRFEDDKGIFKREYNSLAELNEEWEDYEEPKTFWAISWAGEPEEYDYKNTPEELKDMAKEIGNYFETKEEAEKAVEKLKAWKRLTDNHFKFLNVKNVTPDVPIDKYYVHIEATFDAAGLDDLKLLFGGDDD